MLVIDGGKASLRVQKNITNQTSFSNASGIQGEAGPPRFFVKRIFVLYFPVLRCGETNVSKSPQPSKQIAAYHDR